MSRRSGISLVIGLLLVACVAQAAAAAADSTGNEAAGQPVITPAPVVTNETGVVGNATIDPAGISLVPTPAATPEVTVAVTVEPTETSTAPVPATTPEDTVSAMFEPTVTEVAAETTPAPEVTVVTIVEPTVTEVPPETTPVPEVTVSATAEPTVTEVTPYQTPVPEITVVATVEPTVTSATPESTPEPEATVNATVEPTVTGVTPETTPAPEVTPNTTGDQDEVSLATLNPAFTHYLNEKALSRISMVKQGYALGFVPPPIDLSHLKGVKVSWAAVETEAAESGTDLATQDIQGTGYPSAYDLRVVGKVSPIRDQGSCGSCWAFAAYGSLESTLLPGETWDFSENNMLNNNGWDLGHCDGGSDIMAMAYLARWSGPVNEKADPYSLTSLVSPPDLRVRKHAQGMFVIPQRMESTDNSNLKAAIMNYGGVYSTMEWNPEAYNPVNASYYYDGGYWPNHAVTIIGWDDGYDRNKFAYSDGTTTSIITPPENGAFIAKNSWGTGFGSGGYLYISYDDPMIGMGNTVFTAEPLKNLKRVYQYDDLGWVLNIGDGEDSDDIAWFANVFTSMAREQVAAVSFYTSAENSKYTIFVYTDPSNGPVNNVGPVSTKSGSFELAGYHTVNLDEPVLVNLGQKFSVVVQLQTPGVSQAVPVEMQIPGYYTSRAVANAGESYVAANGQDWKDTTTVLADYPNTNVCLKAFTVPAVPPPDARFTAAPKKGNMPLKVYFRDRSLRKPASWLWDFGDGTTSTEHNPIHTYAKTGTFTVTLTVENSGGEDFTTKENLITVGNEKRKARPYLDFHEKDEESELPDR